MMKPIRQQAALLCAALLLAALFGGSLFRAPAAHAQDVPHPRAVFGFEPGADYKLANYGQMLDYYEQLEAASERVQMEQIGTSAMGKPMMLLFISSPENLAELERWRSISERLSRARIDSAQAQQLAREGRAVAWVDAGMHATETAHGQMAPELAYRLATEETPEMQSIRDNVVTLLMPMMNPDGLNIVENWYDRVLGTPYETSSPPWLYQKYVGHDNNRDYFMNNMPETRAVTNMLYRQWYPQVVYNHHQTSPAWARIFIPPFSDPVNQHIHPGVVAGVNEVGAAMASRFAVENMPGVVSRNSYTMFWNGGGRTTPYFHNQIGILTETGHRTPTPRFYEPDSIPSTIGGGVPTDSTAIFYADPWRGGESHLRDAVEYMLTASVATLDLVADRREQFLHNIYKMGRDAIEAGEAGTPYAYVIPNDGQWNEREATNLVNILRRGGVEIHRVSEGFEAGGQSYQAGAYIAYAAQAFRPYLMDLLEEQRYPTRLQYPGGPPDQPYDLAGWTLPIQMGVTVDRIDRSFDVAATELEEMAAPEPGRVTGTADYGWALSHHANASVEAVNRLLADGATVAWTGGPLEETGGQEEGYGTGTFVIEAGEADAQVDALAEEMGLDFAGLAEAPSVPLRQIELPRVGLYKSWHASIDEGWTRWVLQNYQFPVDTLHDADIREGDLSQYDALILPSQDAETILHGHEPGTMPEEFVGGVGLEGALAIKRYVEDGGMLVAFDAAAGFAIEQLGLPVRNAVEGVSDEEFFIPGSLIRMAVNTEHPLAHGMQEEASASFSRSRAFEVVRPDRMGEGGFEDTKLADPPPVEVVTRYAEDDLLLSGWAMGEKEYLSGKPAMLRVRQGEGSVVLFAFRPQQRGQSRGTYKLIFNALHGATVDDLPQVGNVSADPRATEE